MPGKNKWLAIYLAVAVLPIFIYNLPQNLALTSHVAVHNYLFFAPYVGLALIGLLGWQINQTRIFWSALFLLAFYHYFLHPSLFFSSTFLHQKPDIVWEAVGKRFEIICASFPLALSVNFLLRECRLWSDRSLARFLLTLSPFILLTALYHWVPDTYGLVFHWSPKFTITGFRVPPLAWLTTTGFLMVIYFLPDLKIRPFLISLAVSFLPFYLAVQASFISSSRFYVIISFTAISLILLHSVLHMYWKKVYMDILTGVPNRQALDERLHNLGKNYVLAMVDIDHFKKFNDNYGHAEGDNALRMVAQHLEEHLGFGVYRYGGEEFCVVFEGEKLEHAAEKMDKTRKSLEKRKFVLRQPQRHPGDIAGFFTKKTSRSRGGIPITISVGVAAAGKDPDGYEKVIKKADKALYVAKEKGRNRVVS